MLIIYLAKIITNKEKEKLGKIIRLTTYKKFYIIKQRVKYYYQYITLNQLRRKIRVINAFSSNAQIDFLHLSISKFISQAAYIVSILVDIIVDIIITYIQKFLTTSKPLELYNFFTLAK